MVGRLMVLHIAIEGVDGVGKTTLTQKLYDYFQRKKYRTRICTQPLHKPIHEILRHYNLLNHEIALIMAFDRSLTYYMEDWEQYDIIIWDRSILSSYAYNTDKNVHATYIRSINRYFPEMDLYIIINNDQVLDKPDYAVNIDYKELTEKYKKLANEYPNAVGIQYQENQQSEMFLEALNQIHERLPTCKWCGRLYTINKHHKKYCSQKCKHYSRQEQNRKHRNKYYHKYKDVLAEHEKGSLGSKGSLLHEHPHEDFDQEHQLIVRENYRQGLL